MKRRFFLALIALIAAFALVMAGCGKSESETTAPAQSDADTVLALSHWTLSSSTWSSPNGATVHLSATPEVHTEGQDAAFIVRLEGDEILSVPCQWDGTHYTADAELNAADGYCYYVLLTTESGRQAEVAVNTPEAPVDETLIDIEASLNTYCNLLVEESESADGQLTLTAGSVQIQTPRIRNNGEAVTCTEAVLVLSFNGEEVARKALDLPAAGETGLYEMPLSNISFDVPKMEDDNVLSLRLDVTLSNGYILNDANGTWSYMDGQLLGIVG